MTAPKTQYDNNRFPIQIEKGKCRGCHEPVPKGRRTWCSNACNDKFDPRRVRYFCRVRDNEICSQCGIDTERMRNRFLHACRFPAVNHWEYYTGNELRREEYDKACAIARKHSERWHIAAKKRKSAMVAAGWPYHATRDWWEMDHIIPFSEGGLTVLENVRTLCVLCHKKRTKKWHKERKQPKSQEAFL